MTNFNANIREIYGYMDEPRFEATRLAGFTVAVLRSLRDDSVKGLKIDPKADELWNQLVAREPLNSAEREIIDQVIRSLQEGVSQTGLSYEEMGASKGMRTTYAPESITLLPVSGKPVVVPNFPVPPVPMVIPRPYQEWVDPWVVANFDIVSGDVEEIRQRKDLDACWTGKYSRVNISGLDSLKKVVTMIVATSSQWPTLKKDKKSCQGLQFFDLWTTACATCPFDYYLALHDVIIIKCLTQNVLIPTPETAKKPAKLQKLQLKALQAPTLDGMETAYPKESITMVKKSHVTDVEVESVLRFIEYNRHAPYFLSGPIKTMINYYVAEAADQKTAVLAYQKLQKFFGGKKRGLGRIAASWNYGPRMSKTWREINILSAIADSLEGAVDIRVSSGAFSMMLDFCKRTEDPEVKLLLSDEQEQLRTGLTVSERAHVTLTRRSGATYVGMQHKVSVPDFDPKKPSESSQKLEAAYDLWKATLPAGDFYLVTKVFCEKAFKDYEVYSLQNPFDLSAVVTNIAVTKEHGPIEAPTLKHCEAEDFFQQAVQSMRTMATWWHAPERTYSPLAGYFEMEPSTVTWSMEHGFAMASDFYYGEEDNHGIDGYDDPEPEETWDSESEGAEVRTENTQTAVANMNVTTLGVPVSGVQTPQSSNSSLSNSTNFSGTDVQLVQPTHKRRTRPPVANNTASAVQPVPVAPVLTDYGSDGTVWG